MASRASRSTMAMRSSVPASPMTARRCQPRSHAATPSLSASAACRCCLRPAAVAVDGEGALVVVDQGDTSIGIPPALWRLSSSGEVVYDGDPPLPQPLYSQARRYSSPRRCAADGADIYVVDLGDGTMTLNADASLYRFRPSDGMLDTLLSPSTHPGWAVRPVDMVLDAARSLVILDRGTHPIGDPPSRENAAAVPRLVVVGRNQSRPTRAGQYRRANSARDRLARRRSSPARGPVLGHTGGTLWIDPANGWQATPLLEQAKGQSAYLSQRISFWSDTTLLSLRHWRALGLEWTTHRRSHPGRSGGDLPGRPGAVATGDHPRDQRSSASYANEESRSIVADG